MTIVEFLDMLDGAGLVITDYELLAEELMNEYKCSLTSKITIEESE